ncbi:transcription elongation factor GreA [Acetomicrobium thermoterrenum DSM 13490]|uniref:Transcription elongation factor GreA n=1 Tax=Acetomicrobium thermoterrenum DSM 13490 TaxID=1120987 RepID=A0A1H3E9I3_9BACT|nr:MULTISPECIES: transcription elongation factor GreA [Acetomicrobium]SDX75376.1 transcription elongation factor GreA [Acetomicrobium thermoterrenum DSM 13490]
MSTQRTQQDDVILMTREGYQKLRAELIKLRSEGRSEISQQLEEARSFGDLSENAEYHAAKEAQAKLEARIQQLETQLSKAKVIENDQIDTSQVTLGTKVTLKDLDLNREFTYVIVNSEETDPNNHKISVSSPVGQAIIGKSVGDEVIARAPRGVRRLKILNIDV